MNMNRIKSLLPAIVIGAVCLNACDDLFTTDPDNIINADDYISTDDEMYKGFMGIMTRMQKAADVAIILTDTRGDYLDATANAPLELQHLWQYEPTDGNSYADPSPFYSVVIACNDYIDKMGKYRQKIGDNMDENAEHNYRALISNALRLKVWAYLKLGTIYGEAVWFDDALEERKELSDKSVFTYCTLEQLLDRLLEVLDGGIIMPDGDKISSQLLMDWASWINEEDVTTNYDHWRYMVPEYLSLKCEILIWRGEESDYRWVRDNVLEYLYKCHMGTINDGVDVIYNDYRYACNIPIRTGADNVCATEYYTTFFNELYNVSNWTNLYQVVTGIMYDYENNQRNRIVEYFCPVEPGKYYLRPSRYAIGKYNESDLRGIVQRNNIDVINGDTCFVKYYYHRGEWLRTRIVEIQPVIPLYRGHDYHFWVAEAENHLHQWHQAEVIMNKGVTNEFADKTLPTYWNKNYNSWFCPAGGYGDIGVAHCVYGNTHDFPIRALNPVNKKSDGTGPFFDSTGREYNEEERMRQYDLLITDEALSEYAGEGRSYSWICRMAHRYGPEYVVDKVAEKYRGTPYYEKVRSAILAGNYWVKWNLKVEDLKK